MTVDLGFKLKENAEKYSSKSAVYFQDKKLTYKELNERAVCFANAMISLGLKPKDKVSVILRNCSEYVEIICGLIKAGLVHVPINWRLSPQEMDIVINKSDSVAVIIGQEFLEPVTSIQQKLAKVPRENYVMVGTGTPESMLDYEKLLGDFSTEEPGIKNAESDPFFIGFTSGSTGTPKGAITRHANWEIKTLGLTTLYGCNEPDDVQLLTMPLFHMNGINTMGASLYLGQTVVCMAKFEAKEALRLIQKYKCTYSSMVPTMYHRIKNLPEKIKCRYDLSSMKSLIQSSAPLPFATKKWIVEFFKGAGLFEGYGGTEAGAIAFMLPKDQLIRPGSVGQIVPSTEIRIIGEDGNDVSTGQVGQIISRSRTTDGPIPPITEYYNDPEATSKNFKDGWFYGGDMGYLDQDGYLYLVDRVEDMIICGGENIYPKEIEDALLSHPSVDEVAVVGVPDEEWGEAVKAVIVLKASEFAQEAELIEHSKKYVGKFKVPKSIDFKEELPKTETGKILRRLVKAEYWKGREKRI